METGHCQRRGRRPKASGNQKPKPGGDEAGMLTAKRQGCWPGGEALVMLLAPIRESLPPSVLPCIWQLPKILAKNVTFKLMF